MDRVRDASEATTVIVADDDESMRSLLAEALRNDGYVVREAHDGTEVLELLDDPDLRTDVVLIDVKMPKLSGLGVLHALRRASWSLPVVVMTGLADASIRTVALQLGAVGVLNKPFGPDEVLAAVDKANVRARLETTDGCEDPSDASTSEEE
jgi:DNA-binding response OmpR family regulator